MDHDPSSWSDIPCDLLETIADSLILSTDYSCLRGVCLSWRSVLPEVTKPQFPWLLLPVSTNKNNKTTNSFRSSRNGFAYEYIIQMVNSVYKSFTSKFEQFCGSTNKNNKTTKTNNSSSIRRFLNLSDNRVHEFELPGIHKDMVYRGSSMGWLITLDKHGPEIRLINPITAVEIQLPPLSTFPDILEYRPNMVDHEYIFQEWTNKTGTESLTRLRDFFIWKAILSSSSSSSKPAAICSYKDDHNNNNNNNNYYMAMAIYSDDRKLAVCKRGDTRWTAVESKFPFFDDMIFYKGRFYAVNEWGRLMVILMVTSDDVDHHGGRVQIPKAKVVVPSPLIDDENNSLNKVYLAEVSSTGELLMIVRHQYCYNFNRYDHPPKFLMRTTSFDVYKLDKSKRNRGRKYIGKWRKVEGGIGHDIMLFLGWNSTFCLSTTSNNFPTGFRGNCIYFTDDNSDLHLEGILGGSDLGVFCFDDQSIEPFSGYKGYDPKLNWPPPIWFTPIPSL